MAADFRPLEGVVVADFSQWLPGRLCTSLLADLGASVTWILPPRGDRMRPLNPRLCDRLDEGKTTLTLDLADPGVAAPRLERLFRESDVVVEGYRPRVAERLGITLSRYGAARSAGVLCSLPAYRRDSAYEDVPAHDLALQGWVGLLDVDQPMKPSVAVVDVITALLAVTAITAARNGLDDDAETRQIELPLADAALFWSMLSGLAASPSARAAVPGNGIYRCRDGRSVTLTLLDEAEWRRFAEATAAEGGVEIAEAARGADPSAAQLSLEGLMASATSESWLERLGRSGVAVGPVLDLSQALSDDYFAEGLPHSPNGFPAIRFPVNERERKS